MGVQPKSQAFNAFRLLGKMPSYMEAHVLSVKAGAAGWLLEPAGRGTGVFRTRPMPAEPPAMTMCRVWKRCVTKVPPVVSIAAAGEMTKPPS